MTQTSYPQNNANITTAMWRSLFRGTFHSGIVDDTLSVGSGQGNAIALGLPASGNNVTVGVGKFSLYGFVCEITVAESLYMAPVASGQVAVVYEIGFMFDPAKDGSLISAGGTQDGPISLQVFPSATVVVPPGGAWWWLYRVTRSTGVSLLNSANTVIDRRRWIGVTYQGEPNGLDKVTANSNAPRGSLAVMSGQLWSRQLNSSGVLDWLNLDSPPWTPLTLASAVARAHPSSGSGVSMAVPSWRVVRGELQLAGSIQPPTGTTYFSSAYSTFATIPAAAAPNFDKMGLSIGGKFDSESGTGGALNIRAVIGANSTANLEVAAPRYDPVDPVKYPGKTWLSLDGISVPLTP